ncbi:hypothetical protein CROQUDRAFT_67484 [Cronartium quercuum f. sp. fusiforme G11]|uniref:Uncharacterized protein n=1 Tax=Cronartium quercuum f. sp. fusiforme G11 TaxID=708437 RepID=A0A9P6T7L8_9BASI|nr:hypothetical protein CROQUDRAFT_67484 [Cronartium quercuum f. sp. fusiforme G11]
MPPRFQCSGYRAQNNPSGNLQTLGINNINTSARVNIPNNGPKHQSRTAPITRRMSRNFQEVKPLSPLNKNQFETPIRSLPKTILGTPKKLKPTYDIQLLNKRRKSKRRESIQSPTFIHAPLHSEIKDRSKNVQPPRRYSERLAQKKIKNQIEYLNLPLVYRLRSSKFTKHISLEY